MSINDKTIFKKLMLAYETGSQKLIDDANEEYLQLCREAQRDMEQLKKRKYYPRQSSNMRISQLLNTNNLGGTITFGNTNTNKINRLNGIEGQLGGLPSIPKNKF